MKKDICSYIEFNKWVEEDKEAKEYNEFVENQEFKTSTMSSLQKQFPNATTQEIKKRMKVLASQLELLNDDGDDYMSTS